MAGMGSWLPRELHLRAYVQMFFPSAPYPLGRPRIRGALGRRFVTKAEVERLGMGHLMGTPLLRAYMHGFFMHARLWQKARAIAEPFAYEAWRAQRVAEKLDAQRKTRITRVQKLPKVEPRVWGKYKLLRTTDEMSLLACVVIS